MEREANEAIEVGDAGDAGDVGECKANPVRKVRIYKDIPQKNIFDPDRVFARVTTITESHSISEEYDCVRAGGYFCVVSKGEYKIGNLVVHITPDSIVDPSIHEYFTDIHSAEFKNLVEKRSFDIHGHRYISNGLVFPATMLKEINPDFDICDGANLTELFKIRKYVHNDEIAVYTKGVGNFRFPVEYSPKTDEDRLQNQPAKHFAKFQGRNVVVTTKMDGTSATYLALTPDSGSAKKFIICGRNFEYTIYDAQSKDHMDVAQEYDLENKMIVISQRFGRSFAIQLEIVGNNPLRKDGVVPAKTKPKNTAGLAKATPFVFNMYWCQQSVDEPGMYMSHDEIVEIAGELGLPLAPVIFRGKFEELCEEIGGCSIEKFEEFSGQQKYENGHNAEGIVIKTDGEPVKCSFKVISPNYGTTEQKREKKNEKRNNQRNDAKKQ